MVRALRVVADVDEEADAGAEPRKYDQRVFMRDMTWEQYEALLKLRGPRPRPRIYYLDGTIELMTTSLGHEALKKMLARLLEAWADEHRLEFNGYGSWTLKSGRKSAGAEPDECYMLFGTPRTKRRPDLAIEVTWTRGGLEKLEIYRRLGVCEVWMVGKSHAIQVYALRGDRYERVGQSALLLDLDLVWLASFLAGESQSEAVRAFRKAMRTKKR